MADPTLKRTSVQINYTASDGYRSEVGYSSDRSESPEAAYIAAIDELSRLAHLFGFGDRARAAFDAAAQRTTAALEAFKAAAASRKENDGGYIQ